MIIKVILYSIALLTVLIQPASVYAAPDGAALFGENCVVCHRKGGEGSIGLPLKKEKFSTLSNDYLRKTIRNGRPGRIMPAFDRLSDAQVGAIVKYLRTWSKSSSPDYSGATARGDVEQGKKLFDGYCANCHGPQGQGLGKGTGQTYSREREFQVVPPAVGNVGFLDSASDAMLRDVITNGRKGTLMAAFGKLGLKSQQIDDIIVYLRSLQADLKAKQESTEKNIPEPSIIVDSPNDFETTVASLKQALSGYNFRIFPDRPLEKGLFPEWETDKKKMTIRYCNFNNLYDMLKIDPRLGIGLPCRITVVESADGKVQLIAMNMALIARLFNNDQLRDYAIEMDAVQREVLDEVTF